MKEFTKDIVIGTDVVGHPIYITKYTIDSEKPGKTVYIQGGIHGGEITLHMIRDIYNYVKENITEGKVFFIPFANPFGWGQKAYTYTVGKFNYKTGEDFNRTFGSNSTGNTSVQIAKAILKECEEEKIDFAVDLHTAHTSFPHTISFSENDLDLIKTSNIEYNRLCYNSEEYKTTLNYQLTKRGINNFTIECGSHDSIEKDYQKQVVEGVLNVLNKLNICNFTQTLNKTNQVVFSKATTYFAECGGIVEFNFELGQHFKKGDVLFTIHPANLQEESHKQLAEFDGVIFRYTKTHIYNAFDEVMRVFKNEDLKQI
ncbi:MAG: succinylglutamate desuccinylase/aspartoacylase family protein [Clostridia bacterium]|nr:succinylglutamate desuccinylase/aspartoacylase family protein [Clostridia bacterium]